MRIKMNTPYLGHGDTGGMRGREGAQMVGATFTLTENMYCQEKSFLLCSNLVFSVPMFHYIWSVHILHNHVREDGG